LFFSYNNNAFTNVLRLFTNGGIGMGPVAATATAPGTNVIYTNNLIGMGTGLTSPTARIHIVGGSDSGGAPLRLNSGSLLTSPLSGTIEFNGTNLFVTSGTTRQTILTTLTNNAAVTSSFLVSTASDMTLRVPGAAGETSRSVIVTSNRTPTPTLGGDTFLFISGATSSKGTATRGTAVLAGDVVVSGTLHGGVQFGSSTGLTIQANKVQVTANTLSFGQSGGSDTGFFVSGSIGSRGVADSGGTSLFGGDLYASGVSYFANGLSGSLTRLTDGTSYLVAGANVTITTGSNGSVTIASTGGGGGGTPGGSDTQVQFNDGGSFGGDADLTFNKTTNVLGATVIDAGDKSVTVTGITGAMVVRGGPNAPGLFGVGSQTVHLVGTGANGSGAGIVFGDYSSTVGVGIFEDTDDTMLVKSSGRMRVQSSGQNVEVQANSYVDVRSSVSYVNIAPATYASISPDAAEIGSNVFFHVSGSSGLQSAPASQGVSVFGGDVVLSGGLYGGYNSFIGNTYLSAQAAKIQIVGASTGNPPPVSATDTFLFISGAANTSGADAKKVVFGGDVVVSGNIRASEIELGSASAFVSSSNGSSLEIGAATQVLILSGGSATSRNPRNFPDTNFFVSGSIATATTTTRGTAVFGGDTFVSGQIFFGGDSSSAAAVSRFIQVGQTAYIQNWNPTAPIFQIAGKFGATLSRLEAIASTTHLISKVRIGGALADSPTAYLHLSSSTGAATTAPLKFQSGSLMATPETGAVEFNGVNLFITSGTTRQAVLTTLANNAAVTSSFHVSTGSDLTLRVPGAAGDTARSIIMTSDRTPTPTVGTDTFVFVSGSTSSKGTSTRGTAVFGGDVVVSGTIFGGVNPTAPSPTTDLVLRGDQVKITKNALSFGQFGGQDVAVFVSGTVDGKNSGGVSLIGGDTVISGSLYLEKAVVPTVVSPVTNSFGASPNSTGFITSSLALGNIFRVTLTNNTGSFLAPTNAKDGQQATWIVKQDATGTRLGVWATGSNGFAWPGGIAPILSTSGSAVDMVTAQYDESASRWFATFAKGFV
jgi:hypothetical protein